MESFFDGKYCKVTQEVTTANIKAKYSEHLKKAWMLFGDLQTGFKPLFDYKEK